MTEIAQIKAAAGPYARWALEARKEYINLRLRQDPEIQTLYIRLIAKFSRQLKTATLTRESHLKKIMEQLQMEADNFRTSFTGALEDYVKEAVSAGAGYSRNVTVSLFEKSGSAVVTSRLGAVFSEVNRKAVEACWARTHKGLYLSDRIWQQGENLHTTIRDIIQEAVAIGQDAAKTAAMLEQYVRTDAKTLSKNYPNMMKRMAGRIPGSLSYEALRLARTETTAAFGEGAILGGQASPSYTGVKWVLSRSHPVTDICDELAGEYEPGNEPRFPGHPNCICHLQVLHQDATQFKNRIKAWISDPAADPGLETWYQTVYLKAAS